MHTHRHADLTLQRIEIGNIVDKRRVGREVDVGIAGGGACRARYTDVQGARLRDGDGKVADRIGGECGQIHRAAGRDYF